MTVTFPNHIHMLIYIYILHACFVAIPGHCGHSYNPFMHNGISHPYHLDEPILNYRIVGWKLTILFKFLKYIL